MGRGEKSDMGFGHVKVEKDRERRETGREEHGKSLIFWRKEEGAVGSSNEKGEKRRKKLFMCEVKRERTGGRGYGHW